MNSQDLFTFEDLSTKIYQPTNPDEQKNAEKALAVFQTTQYIPQLQFVMENATSAYAQMYASISLCKIFNKSWQSITSQRFGELRNWAIGYLGNRGPEMNRYLLASFVQLVSTVTKYAWNVEESSDPVALISQFLQASPTHYIIGLQIFSQLVSDMNQTMGHALSQQRKIAISFRDTALLEIFTLALNALHSLHRRTMTVNDPSKEEALKENALELCNRALSFDFIGTAPDESFEDLGTVQLPAAWRQIIEEPGTLGLFFDLYNNNPPNVSHRAMQCLVQLVSVRRSLFTSDTEKKNFLNQIMTGIGNILQNQTGLQESSNHHEFCRLLARLKANYQLSQIVSTDNYQEWITLLCNFTLQSFRSWNWGPNSTHYLLILWSRLVSAMSFLRGEAPSLLENYAPQVAESYILSRLESVKLVQAGTIDDPLDDEGELREQLDILPYIARCSYANTAQFIVSLFDPLVNSFQQRKFSNPSSLIDDDNAEVGQLAWLVYIIGAVVGGRMALSLSNEQDQLDGELASRVFHFIRLQEITPAQLPAAATNGYLEKLELAFIYFLQQFRKVYIGDQATSATQVYVRLSELLNLSDHLMVLELLVSKIGTNLKCWHQSEQVIEKSLSLFHEIASSYSGNRLLMKIEISNEFLAHHTSQNLPFLDNCSGRYRTLFYNILGKMLFMNIENFDSFMEPFTASFDMLLSFNTVERFRTEDCRVYLARILQDLHGLVSASSNTKSFTLIFEWLHPKYTPILYRAAEVLFDSTDVITPLLKFYLELVSNKGGRLHFDSYSVNGILLFREASNVLMAYGSKIINYHPLNPYPEKYKGIYTCIKMVTTALNGNYLNFGVFGLYGDPALSNALGMIMKLSLSIPLHELMSYPKVAKAYFNLLEYLVTSHIMSVVSLDNNSFVQVLFTIKQGLESEPATVTQCCTILDQLTQLFYTKMNNQKDPNNALVYREKVVQFGEVFTSMLGILLRLVLFEECNSQWAISRPLLILIFLFPEEFKNFKEMLIMNQPMEHRQAILEATNQLMSGVEADLSVKNRDKFSQNINKFCFEVRNLLNRPT